MKATDIALDILDGDPNINDINTQVQLQQFEIIPAASERRREILADGLGFSYCINSRRGDTTYWRCCVRNKQVTCPATVTQTSRPCRPSTFAVGSKSHVHQSIPGISVVAKVRAQVKDEAVRNVFEPASNVVDRVLVDVDVNVDAPMPSLPTITNLARAANYHRRRNKPQDPSDLEFVLQKDHIPKDFLVSDIRVGNHRHLIFATTPMLSLLHKALQWFVDATFKVVKAPFYQLLSVHAFVKREGAIKQIPLVYVLMSARHTRDYKAVFEAILLKFDTPAAVRCVVSDFEAAIWRAVKEVFWSGVEHHGCTFHWGQAVWRKLQDNGLAAAYMKHDAVHKYWRRLMNLPFLPAADIPTAFTT